LKNAEFDPTESNVKTTKKKKSKAPSEDAGVTSEAVTNIIDLDSP